MAAAKVVWFLGLQSGIIGPTLGGMAELVGQASGTALAAQFSFRSAGFLLGTLAVGVVFDASARQHLFTALATAGLALGLACLPLMPSREAMYALWVPAGVCMGFVDTGVNLLVLDAWKGGNSTPWMNLLHFMWGVGSFISPLQVILPPAPAVSNEGGSSELLVLLPAVSWSWVPAWGSLEPSRQDGENAQKTRKKRGKNGRDTA